MYSVKNADFIKKLSYKVYVFLFNAVFDPGFESQSGKTTFLIRRRFFFIAVTIKVTKITKQLIRFVLHGICYAEFGL